MWMAQEKPQAWIEKHEICHSVPRRSESYIRGSLSSFGEKIWGNVCEVVGSRSLRDAICRSLFACQRCSLLLVCCQFLVNYFSRRSFARTLCYTTGDTVPKPDGVPRESFLSSLFFNVARSRSTSTRSDP